MADEKELGLKAGEEKTSDGNGQPENNAHESLDELDKELDNILSKEEENDDDIEDGDDDTVVLSKAQLKKIKSDRDNYRAGLKSIKTKIAARKEAAKPKENKPYKKEDVQQKDRDKQAIEIACEDPEINDNWNEIIKLYKADGRETVAQKLKGIREAHAEWKKSQETKENKDEDKEAKADLATEKGKPAGQGGQEGKNKERKHVLPKKTPIKDWY